MVSQLIDCRIPDLRLTRVYTIKMTSAAADHVGIIGRGTIRPGAYADLVLFDPETVADRATPDDPNEPSVGIDRVLVNGTIVYENGHVTDARPGLVIRRNDR